MKTVKYRKDEVLEIIWDDTTSYMGWRTLTNLKKAPENNVIRIAEYIKGNMMTLHKDKVDLGLFKLTLKKPSTKLGAIDESLISGDFFTVIPESRKLDKRALLKAAKESPIEGVELAESERSLLIK